MAVRGKVYVVPRPERGEWEIIVHNTGPDLVGVTQNVLPPSNPNMRAHDDHTYAGHGLLAQPNGGVSRLSIRNGDTYVHHGHSGPDASHPITPGCHLRVGLRGNAQHTMPLPPLDGEPVAIDFKDFQWYAGSPDTATPDTGNMANHAAHARRRLEVNIPNGASIVAQIQALLEASKSGILVKGKATITAVPAQSGVLSHYEVKFENSGKQAFIGTVAFVGANKRDGVGLESMGCPNQGSAAVQRIESMGNYGKVAAAGAMVRLGVRGHSFIEVPLPAQGAVEIPLDRFTLDTKQNAPEFFDPVAVDEKRREKLHKVQFFENGVAINGEIKPITYRGEEARARCDFDPPHVIVRGVAHSDETPGGGWTVEITNKLPSQDERGEVGFVATLKLGAGGWDPAQVPPKRFEAAGEKKSWFIPSGANLNGVSAAPGQELNVGTRGLGWFATIPLPEAGAVVDANEQFSLWGYREDQFVRAQLARDFTGKCRL